MSTPTRTKPKLGAELMAWLNKAPEKDAPPKEKEKPKEPQSSTRHFVCSACYPIGYTGAGVAKCGWRFPAGGPPIVATPRHLMNCAGCALIEHRRPLDPCPNDDCPLRSLLGQLWRVFRPRT